MFSFVSFNKPPYYIWLFAFISVNIKIAKSLCSKFSVRIFTIFPYLCKLIQTNWLMKFAEKSAQKCISFSVFELDMYPCTKY